MHPSIALSEVIDCPSREMLAEFDLGRVGGIQHAELAAHISSCERCEDALNELSDREIDDRVVNLLKRCLDSPEWDEPAYIEMKQLAETVQVSYFGRGDLQATNASRIDQAYDRRRLPTLKKYELLSEIGHGGMGVVYRGRQLSLDWIVAIKMISAGRYASPKSIARFTREGKVLARLEHPNVVEIYDFDIQDGFPYLVMELMEGGSLQSKLSDGPLAPRVAAELVRTLARAVDYMHLKGIVHRDLKPANILLGLDGTPKISDFGLAKLLDPDSEGLPSPPLTDTGALLGTVNYMAPEQVFSKSNSVGPSIDIYALGAILYETLTGVPPFAAATKLQVLDLVRGRAPIPPSRGRPDVPAWLEEVCLKCLEKNPGLRYPTAEALAVDLDRWLADERPPAGIRRFARIWRGVRRPGVVALACGAPLLLLALGIGRNDSESALRSIQAKLGRGQAVALIGETGLPAWYRWNSGEALAKVTRGPDGTTSLQSWDTALLDLSPDPGSDRYRIRAQIRHDLSETSGNVGLYFAHRTHPVRPHDAHFFLEVAFNAVRGAEDVQARVPIQLKLPKSPILNKVKLRPHLISPGVPRANFDLSLSAVEGPGFASAGSFNGRWHDLEVVVTPEDLTIHWNDETFSTSVEDLQNRIDADLADDAPIREKILPPTFHPKIDLRGSLGLYLRGGSASFRSLTIEPL